MKVLSSQDGSVFDALIDPALKIVPIRVPGFNLYRHGLCLGVVHHVNAITRQEIDFRLGSDTMEFLLDPILIVFNP